MAKKKNRSNHYMNNAYNSNPKPAVESSKTLSSNEYELFEKLKAAMNEDESLNLEILKQLLHEEAEKEGNSAKELSLAIIKEAEESSLMDIKENEENIRIRIRRPKARR